MRIDHETLPTRNLQSPAPPDHIRGWRSGAADADAGRYREGMLVISVSLKEDYYPDAEFDAMVPSRVSWVSLMTTRWGRVPSCHERSG